MALDTSGKTALVTGAGRGICLAFAQELLNHGCNVVVVDLTLSPEAEAVYHHYQQGPARAKFIKTDVTEWAQLQNAFDLAISEFGRLDIVCPGAGIFEPPWASFWNFNSSDDKLASNHYKALDINLTHPIRCTQLAIDSFIRQKFGHGVVIHTSSVSAQMQASVVPLYSASKAAISHFVRGMEFMEPAYNIRINAVAPGNVKTTLWTDAGRDVYHDEQKGDVWVTPDRVAKIMLDLVTKPEYVGGSVWEVSFDSVRKVEMLNDPGPDWTAKGLTLANVGVAQGELAELVGTNFGN